MSHAGEPTWWRRNRRALIALPVVAALTAGATSERLLGLWLPGGPHRAQVVHAGVATDYAGTYEDFLGEHDRRVRVTIYDPVEDPGLSALDVDYEDEPLPSNARVWRVDVKYQADPDLPLFGCDAALVAQDGSRVLYDADRINFLYAPDPVCEPVNSDLRGPFPAEDPALVPVQEPTEDEPVEAPTPRPTTYFVPLYFVLEEGKLPAEVQLWWEFPDYLSVPVEPGQPVEPPGPSGAGLGASSR